MKKSWIVIGAIVGCLVSIYIQNCRTQKSIDKLTDQVAQYDPNRIIKLAAM
jgi:hypothetical protein